ncbi:hypothetical protein GCM10027614_00800 [Micromonospora vulcania]
MQAPYPFDVRLDLPDQEAGSTNLLRNGESVLDNQVAERPHSTPSATTRLTVTDTDPSDGSWLHP